MLNNEKRCIQIIVEFDAIHTKFKASYRLRHMLIKTFGAIPPLSFTTTKQNEY